MEETELREMIGTFFKFYGIDIPAKYDRFRQIPGEDSLTALLLALAPEPQEAEEMRGYDGFTLSLSDDSDAWKFDPLMRFKTSEVRDRISKLFGDKTADEFYSASALCGTTSYLAYRHALAKNNVDTSHESFTSKAGLAEGSDRNIREKTPS